jgi:hypothetical protein
MFISKRFFDASRRCDADFEGRAVKNPSGLDRNTGIQHPCGVKATIDRLLVSDWVIAEAY